jgi:hypothetical protein
MLSRSFIFLKSRTKPLLGGLLFLLMLFLPLTALASLFSMNFSHGLNEHSPALFWVVFAIGLSLGFAMKSWVVRRPREVATPPKKES